jgi:hypothetical protein
VRFFLDTEFNAVGSSLTLISIGIVDECGREYYAVSSDFDPGGADVDPWVRHNVLPHIDFAAAIPESQIAAEIVAFVGPLRPEWWAWYGAPDYLLLRQLYGSALPEGWPQFCRELRQLADDVGYPELPPQAGTLHNALDDARHNVVRYDFLARRRPAALFYDAEWQHDLAMGLLSDAWALLDFESRFAGLGRVAVLEEDQRPIFRTPGRVAWAAAKSIEVGVFTAEGVEDCFEVPLEPIGVEVTLGIDDMIAWAEGRLRAEVLTMCVGALEGQVWERVADLFAMAGSAPTYVAAERDITYAVGPGELTDVELPSGITAVFRPDAMVLTAAGRLVGSSTLVGTDKWVLLGRLHICAALALDAARRLHAEGPGAV